MCCVCVYTFDFTAVRQLSLKFFQYFLNKQILRRVPTIDVLIQYLAPIPKYRTYMSDKTSDLQSKYNVY